MLIEKIPFFARTNKYYKAKLNRKYIDDELEPDEREEAPIQQANLISSEFVAGKHMPLIDLDMEAALLPSSTPGHYHLYINKPMSFDDYKKLLTTMYEVGIVEAGILKQMEQHECTTLRLPHIKKQDEVKLDIVAAAAKMGESVKKLQESMEHISKQLTKE